MSTVSLTTDGAVSTLTLERPEAYNAMSEAMAADFAAAVKAVSKLPSKVLVVRGSGPAFSAGGDLGFIETNMARPRAKLAPLMRRFYGSFLSIRSVPQVTVASINGAAVGAGLCLALACDLRVALLDAKCSLNFVRLGLNPGMGAWPLARAAFGDARARELLFTGRSFTGREMVEWGAAIAGASEPGELGLMTLELGKSLAAASGESLRILKAETRLGEKLDPYLVHEAKGQASTFKGRDLVEGVAAVREKRLPVFKG
ncbi:MAG: enoyl-CoA hydratase/isomerase family protein [Elusimicrobiota bacterium]|nr:enoyl-CoA hydratase/isomerase family protein [Elusimicrobiota bacterium]